MRTWRYACWLSGLILCLTGAALIFFRSRILGENYAGIAPVIGILGIGLLGCGNLDYLIERARKEG